MTTDRLGGLSASGGASDRDSAEADHGVLSFGDAERAATARIQRIALPTHAGDGTARRTRASRRTRIPAVRVHDGPVAAGAER